MDPRAGIPLHFSIEAMGLAVAGVVVAWAMLQRRWTSAAGGIALAVAQILYAGQFVTGEGGGAGLAAALRITGTGFIAYGAWRDPDRPLLGAGAVTVLAASVWRLGASRDAATLGLGPRVLVAIGFVLLAVWAWRRAASSVRPRIVAAFLGVVAVAVIVSGGAAARVGVSDAVDDAQGRLERSVLAEQRNIAVNAEDLLKRGALASAVLTQSGPSEERLSQLSSEAFPDVSFVWLVDRGRRVTGADPSSDVVHTKPVDGALSARSATGVVGFEGEAALVAATPVFGASGSRSESDVVGALVVGLRIGMRYLEDLPGRAEDNVTIQLITSEGTLVSSSRTAPQIRVEALGDEPFASGQAELDGVDHLVALARLPVTERPAVALGESLAVADAVDVSAGFPRALVGGVLAAALLAVVIALWLSARLTRPIVRLADEAERVKSEFLSTVSHELRTPLTPIRGYADLLRRDRVPRGRREEYLDEIDEAAGRLERIVMLLVEVAAIQGGSFSIEQEPIAAPDLLKEAAAQWRRRTRRHRFVVRVPKTLPRISADRRTIATVLDELLDNAVKFSPDGGEIELRATRAGSGVKIAVHDEGIGMDPDAVQRLASAFVQAEGGETRRFGGLGLGLTYTSGALAAHGSSLEVSAEPDGGATFSFTLPTTGMVTRMPSRARST